MFTKSILSIFLLNILSILLYLAVGAICVLLFVISGAGATLFKTGASGLLSSITPSVFFGFGAVFVLFFLVMLVIGSAVSSAAILLFDSEGKLSVLEAFRKGITLIIPLTAVGLIHLFLGMGGFFVFVFPGIIISYLLAFSSFEVILNGKRPMEAIKRSVSIVSHNFGDIFVRWFVLILVYFGIAFVLPGLLGAISKELKIYVTGLSFIVNMFLGWYILAFNVTLYKQFKDLAHSKDVKSITWMWIVAIIGWIIALLVFFAGWKLITSPAFLDAFTKNVKTNSAPYAFPTTSHTQVPLPTAGSYQPASSNCTQYPIREGEFTSDKCYSAKDYSDLLYYLQRYDSAASVYNGAIASMNITCNGSEFFKDACARDTTDKTNAENDINNYKGIITAIISRGK